MTKSQIFNTAWTLAKLAASRFGNKASQYFSESLKVVYASKGKAAVFSSRKYGCYNDVIVMNSNESAFSSFRTNDRGNGVVEVMQVTNGNMAVIDSIVDRANAAPVVTARKNSGRRYLELLSIAQRDNLSHGKSWYCGEREIETMGMNPMHEGELVCYVYAN